VTLEYRHTIEIDEGVGAVAEAHVAPDSFGTSVGSSPVVTEPAAGAIRGYRIVVSGSTGAAQRRSETDKERRMRLLKSWIDEPTSKEASKEVRDLLAALSERPLSFDYSS
jgi:hypothetical protein